MLEHLPQLHRHFQSERVVPSMYASSWFMTLFAGELPLPVSERIMDILLLDGPATLFRVALAVLKRSHDRLLLMPFEELVPALRSDLYSAFSGPDDLVADVRRSPVTDKKLAKLEKAFIAERQRVAAAAAAAAAGGEGDADRVRRLEAQLERANAQNAMLQEEVSAHRKTLSNLSVTLGVQREAAAAAAAAAAATSRTASEDAAAASVLARCSLGGTAGDGGASAAVRSEDDGMAAVASMDTAAAVAAAAAARHTGRTDIVACE